MFRMMAQAQVLLLIALLSAVGQGIEIRGRVVNVYQNPLSGCVVTLCSSGSSDTTDVNGAFVIAQGDIAVDGKALPPRGGTPSVNGAMVRFSIDGATRVGLMVFDMQGRTVHEWEQAHCPGGDHAVPLARMITRALPVGIYTGVLTVGEQQVAFKLPVSSAGPRAGGSSLTAHSRKIQPGPAKSAAAVDTLVFQLEYYQTKRVAVESYQVDLGNVVLQVAEANTPPSQPQPAYPTNGQQDVAPAGTLKWECTDQDGDALTYTVYLDTVSPPLGVIGEQVAVDSLALPPIEHGTTYYWRVVAHDGLDSTRSQVFSFATASIEWDELVPQLRKQCYIVGVAYDGRIMGVGTGFAISPRRIMTNAHVVRALIDFARMYGMDDKQFVAVRDGGRLGHTHSHELDSFAIHPDYDSTTTYTYDFGIVTVRGGTLEDTCVYESLPNLYALTTGDEIATIGFPGETNDLNTVQPIATFKSGTISALRPFDPVSTPATDETNVVIQHNFNTTGGTSGSPVFNRDGRVIAIHNSGEYDFIKNQDGTWTRIPVGSLGYSIRIDQRTSMESTPLTAFSAVEPELVDYYFINGTYTDLSFYFRGVLMDTIPYLDTLHYWDYKGEPVNDVVELYSLVATGNYVYWRDTMQTGLDFSRRYIVNNSYFLLGLTNSTNKAVKSCVVSSAYQHDSAQLYLPVGAYADVGYYRSSSLTDVNIHFHDASQYIYWNDLDTRSTNAYAAFIPLEATLTLTKQAPPGPGHKPPKTPDKITWSRAELLRRAVND